MKADESIKMVRNELNYTDGNTSGMGSSVHSSVELNSDKNNK